MGSRLCEVLSLTQICAVRAFVHSTGSAARIARLPLDFALGDLCDAAPHLTGADDAHAVDIDHIVCRPFVRATAATE